MIWREGPALSWTAMQGLAPRSYLIKISYLVRILKVLYLSWTANQALEPISSLNLSGHHMS